MLARAAMDSVASPVEVPTGNGFCLYIKRDLIDAIGLFDEASFPEGYGEEHDFCMRALAAGWYNMVAPRTRVHHVRSASFRERRQALAETGAPPMQKMNPQYCGSLRTTDSYPTL